MVKTFKALSLVTFTLSASVHALTFASGIAISMSFVWPLHVLTLAVCGAMAYTANKVFALQSTPKKSMKLSDQLKFGLRIVKSTWPMILLCLASVFYTADNFGRCMKLMRSGLTTQKDGKYYLESHGVKIREINKNEYNRFCTNETRAFSGHWMLFSLISVTFFFFIYPVMQLENGSHPKSKADSAAGSDAAADL